MTVISLPAQLSERRRMLAWFAAISVTVALVACSTPHATTAGDQPARPIPPEAKTVIVNGYPMAYQEFGSGEPLVLIHGTLLDYRVWYAQTPEFA